MNNDAKKKEHARRNKRFREKWVSQGLCPYCSDHGQIVKGIMCGPCYEKQKGVNSKSIQKTKDTTRAKLSERKTVHEWLTALGIPSSEFGKPLCLLRRLRILCDRYRRSDLALVQIVSLETLPPISVIASNALTPHQDGQEY